MATFLVERYLVGWTRDDIQQLTDRIAQAQTHFGPLGVRHVHSVVVSSDEMCLCVFEGPDADTVARANAGAGFPFDRVVAGDVVIG